LTTTGATVRFFPLSGGESFYVAGPKRGLNAVRFPERINEIETVEFIKLL
jgi:hypothetical protein